MALSRGAHTKSLFTALAATEAELFESTASSAGGFNHATCAAPCEPTLSPQDMLEKMKRLHSWGHSSLADVPLQFQAQLEHFQDAIANLEYSSLDGGAEGHSYEDMAEVTMAIAQLQQNANHLADSMGAMTEKMQDSVDKSKRKFARMSHRLVERGDTLTQSFLEHTAQFSQYFLKKTEKGAGHWRQVSEILGLKESFGEKRAMLSDQIQEMWQDGKEFISHGNMGFDMINFGTAPHNASSSLARSRGQQQDRELGALVEGERYRHERVWEDLLQTASEMNEYVSNLDAEMIQIFSGKLEIGQPEVQAHRVSKLPILVFLLSAVTCLLCSTIYHLFYVQGGLAYEISLSADFAGICVLIAGSFVPLISYGFYCQPLIQAMYISIVYLLCTTAFVMSLMPWCGTAMRVKVFIAVGFFGVLPIGHLIWNNGLSDVHMNESFLFLIIMGFFYLSGAVVYATNFPERVYPGKFDLFLSSHQIWHFFIVIAALCHYHGSLKQYEFAEQATCEDFH
jgi:channel protein (hemolysin III family)